MFHPNTLFHPLAEVRPANSFQADNGLNSIGNRVSPIPFQNMERPPGTITKDEFVVYSMNVHGLTNDDRLVELEQELESLNQWDIVVLTETWRKQKNNFSKTKNGHIFMNRGCEAG